MVDSIRITEKALGKINYAVTEKEAASRVFRRSLFVVKDVKAGQIFTEENIRSIRPGYGLHPRFLHDVIGTKASRNISSGTPLTWKLIAR